MTGSYLYQNDIYDLHVSGFIERPWTLMEPLYVGDVPGGLGTPELYCRVERNLEPYMVANVYGISAACPATPALFWHSWLVIGSSDRIHFISLTEKQEQACFFTGWFNGFYPDGEDLFVCSLDGISCFDSTLQKRWEHPDLGLDGVEITSITEDNLVCSAWQPDDQWYPFTLSRTTGRLLNSSR